MVLLVGERVLLDVAAHEPDLAPVNAAVGLVERHPAVAEAFDFASHQHNATLKVVEHFVLVPCLAIVGDDLLIGVFVRLLRLFLLASRRQGSFALRARCVLKQASRVK